MLTSRDAYRIPVKLITLQYQQQFRQDFYINNLPNYIMGKLSDLYLSQIKNY